MRRFSLSKPEFGILAYYPSRKKAMEGAVDFVSTFGDGLEIFHHLARKGDVNRWRLQDDGSWQAIGRKPGPKAKRELASLEERFFAYVDKNGPGGCWIWTGCKSKKGYGQFLIKKISIFSHRVAWELLKGPIPDGLCVLHDCPNGDNPACVNPDHLWLGTRAENTADMMAKRRNRQLKGSEHPNSKLSESDILEIRRLYSEGRTRLSIAELFSVCESSINQIVNKTSWRHVQ